MAYSNQQLQSLFQQPFNMADYTAFVQDVLKPTQWRVAPEPLPLTSEEGQGYYLGKKNTYDKYELDFYYFRLDSSVVKRRVGLRKLVQTYLRLTDAALVVFDDGSRWRLSFICDLKDETTAPKRFTFVFGDSQCGYHTPVSRFAMLQRSEVTFETLRDAFSVEALTKEFYEKLYNWYLWAIDPKTGVTFPNKIETDTDDRENINRKMIRLITRMLFVWFIKQKNLVPNNLFDIDYLKTILRDFNPQSCDQGVYYNAILQNLFFATLNQEIPDRAFSRGAFQGKSASFTIKNLYRDSEHRSWFVFPEAEKERKVMELFQSVPYLNGGLFDCLDKYTLDETGEKLIPLTYYDGFSSRDSKSPNGNLKYRAFIPNNLFFADEHEETIMSEGGRQVLKVEGLLNIFSQYNFTVEENTPNDTEVSLDPELLGRVFENLLAAYNPETHESARKSTGSFYTPRDIVDYMVDEAIKSYLLEQCHYDSNIVDSLLREHQPQIDAEMAQHLRHDLLAMKILDPACGSGAFPMGFLLRLVDLIEKLTPVEQFNKYNTKLEIIQNCIYGIDIQPIAMLICKLRFFISLICDSEINVNAENFGVMPLPSLETKFVAANSLLSAEVKQYNDDWTQDEHLQKLKQELLDLRIGVINIRKHKDKLDNLRKDKQKCDEIEQYIIAQSSQPNKEKILRLQRNIETLEKQLQLYKSECWVEEMVAQTSLFETGEPSIFRRDINKDKRENILSQIKTCKKEITDEQNKSIPTGFEAAVQQVTTEWNPYDQNKVAKFFDPEWMFGITEGFDVVIGNPPYIQLQNNNGELGNLYKDCGFQTFASTGDIYCLFYERGQQLLKQGGHLCYITSNKWLRAGYGEKLRNFLATKTNPEILIDFSGVKIFESATVDTNILLFSKAQNQQKTICAVTNKQNKDSVHNLSVFVQQQHTVCSFTTSDSWVILSPIEQSIKQKIEAVGTPLKDWDIQIYRGVLTGCNEAFIISTEKRNEILANCKTDDERERTAELIRPILRGRDIKRYGYNWANLWLINTHNGVKERGIVKIPRIDINDYPAVKAHLDTYWNKIADRTDQGDTPYNLRNCAYIEDFSKPKIVYMEIQTDNPNEGYPFPCFSYDTRESVVLNTAYIMCSDSVDVRYILSILNSTVGRMIARLYVTQLQERQYRMLAQYISKFPIAKSTPTVQAEIITIVQKCLDSNSTFDEEYINRIVYKIYGFESSEIAYIENLI